MGKNLFSKRVFLPWVIITLLIFGILEVIERLNQSEWVILSKEEFEVLAVASLVVVVYFLVSGKWFEPDWGLHRELKNKS